MKNHNRPGYTKNKRKNGFSHYWRPQKAVPSAPQGLPSVRLENELSDHEIDAICQELTDDLKLELLRPSHEYGYDGSIGSLIRIYTTKEASPYCGVKHSTRVGDYDPSLKILDKTVGQVRIDQLRGSDFVRWHSLWASGGRLRRAQGCIKLLRAILTFGKTERLQGCSGARDVLSAMRFPAPVQRQTRMESHHAYQIVEKALELNQASIALTQALQWDTALRRIDIIGEWLPCEPGAQGIVHGKSRWQGPTAQNVKYGILQVRTSKSGNRTIAEHDLSRCPLVQLVFSEFPLPDVGPLVVSEDTGRPWWPNYYARAWRRIAQLAGVPGEIRSMDSRAGAISEAEMVAGLPAAQKLATHSSPAMTAKYVRNSNLENNRIIADARADLRK